jgi:hypothetical protein
MSKIARTAVVRSYTHNGKEMSLALSAQELRDAYFELSGQSFRVGQTYSSFGKKEALLAEIKRLIELYAARPEAIAEVAAKEKVAAAKHAEKLQRKAAKELRKAEVEKKSTELMALDDGQLEILLAALVGIQKRRVLPANFSLSKDGQSDSDDPE